MSKRKLQAVPSTAVDSAACNYSSLLGSKASADEPDTIADVVEDQDCHFESQAGEEQSELSEPNDCLATAGECQPRSACSSRDTLSYDIGEIVVECKSRKKLA